MAKENDLLLNQLQNPTYNAFDFKQVGLDVNNTSIEDKEVYKNLDFVRNNPLLQTEGSFDEAKFDVLYNAALSNYNDMANIKVGEEIGSHATFFRDNIYAPIEKRTGIGQVNYSINRVSNPLRRQTGITRIDAITENPLSVREIAQTQRVWDEKTQTWQDSPNDGWFDNWTHTRVLAQWDEEGDHIDPVTGETVHHQKGDKKLNDAGTYYYENLNGRSVYGREVLSKFDTLTTDGSAWNKFDIFDSDDKKKSLGGTLIKNAIKVLPAFCPVVGPWYLGMRVGINMAGLMGTLGNLLTGDSVGAFHGLEGYTQSLKTSQSNWVTGGVSGTAETDTSHAWSLESMLGMAADVFTQLQEQRWLFKYPMQWIKGKEVADAVLDPKAGKAFIEAKALERKKFYKDLLDVEKLTPDELSRIAFFKDPNVAAGITATIEGRSQMAYSWAESQLKALTKDYQKIGKLISMSYMTGVTVQDAYGQAKQEGATDIEAALLTLGYATAEYALINSDLGRWILPELSQEKNMWQQIMKVKASQGLSSEILESTDKVAKSNFVTNMLKLGRQGALYQYMRAAGKNDFTQGAKLTLRAAISNAMGEGVEETSEELLYDLAKGLYNAQAALRGKETRLSAFDNGDWKSILNRYALSFVGGTLGGGLGELHPEFQAASRLHAMTLDEANAELVQIVKEGRADEFINTIEKVRWAPTDIGFDVDENGNFKPVKDKANSQDAIIKKNMVEQVRIIQRILDAEGADLSDREALMKISGSNEPEKEIRFAALRGTKTAQKFLDSYNETLSQLVKDRLEMNRLKSVDTDSSKEKAEELEKREEEIVKLATKIKLEEERIQDFLSGKMSLDFEKVTLFEASAPLLGAFKNTTRASYLENKYQKKISELTPTELEEGEKAWEAFNEMHGADLAMAAFKIFEGANINGSQLIRDFTSLYFDRNSAVGIFSELVNTENAALQEVDSDTFMQRAPGRFVDEGPGFSVDASPITKLARALVTMANRHGIDTSIYEEQFAQLRQDIADGVTDADSASQVMARIIYDPQESGGLLYNDEIRDAFIDEIRTAPYINENVRTELLNVLNKLNQDYVEDDGAFGASVESVSKIDGIINALEANTKRSPIIEFLDKFALVSKATNTPVKFSQLAETLYNLASNTAVSGTLDMFGLDEVVQDQIEDGLKVIELAKAVVNAARTDNAKIGDPYGYNKTINSLDSTSDLAEIDSNTADTIVQEISNFENELLYYKRIADIVSGNKLTEHEKAHTQINTLLYKTVVDRLVKRDDFPPEDWNRDSIVKLKESLSEISGNFSLLASLTKDLETNGNADVTLRTLTDSEKLELSKEMKLFEGALYEFFQANMDSINDVNKLAKFLNAALWGTTNRDNSILTKSSRSLSSAITWYLASIAAGNPEAFHSAYAATWDPETKIAPVAGQELATRLAVTALTNGKVFANFALAQNMAVKQYITEHKDDPELERFISNGEVDDVVVNDSDISIDFLRTILIEGIAGSGKSTGVLKQVIAVIEQDEKIAKELLKNVWMVHTSKEKAYEMAVEAFGEERAKAMKDHCFSHAGLMQAISGTNEKGDTWNEGVDEHGNTTIPAGSLVYEDGEIGYNFGINKTAGGTASKKDAPSIIITDEVSHLSLPSLKLVDKFCEYAGIHHLTFGDFDQAGVQVKTQVEINKASRPYQAYAYNTNFIRSFKLGQSLRTEHLLKDKNNAAARELIARIRENKEAIPENGKMNLEYSVDESLELTGDLLIKRDRPIEQTRAQIKHLLDVTKETPGAKLGYIYDDNDDELTKIMREFNDSDDYKGLIDFKFGTAAQGEENPYYVINISKGGYGTVEGAQLLYTALTRAKVGSVIMQTHFTDNYINEQTSADQHAKAPKYKFTQKSIEDFINRRKAISREVYPDMVPLEFHRYTTVNTAAPVAGNTAQEDIEAPSGQPGKGLVLEDGSGNKFKVIQYNKDAAGNISVILENVDTGEKTTVSLADIAHLNPVSAVAPQGEAEPNDHLAKAGDVDNSDPDDTQMEHHSFNMAETGVIEDDTHYTFGHNAIQRNDRRKGNARVDNVIGLIKLMQASGVAKIGSVDIKNFDFAAQIEKSSNTGLFISSCIEAVRSIQSIGRSAQTEEEILGEIKRQMLILTGNDGSSVLNGAVVRFGLKVSQDSNKDGSNTARFNRDDREKVKHLVSPGKVDSGELISNYTTMLVVSPEGKAVLEIPICCDTNPMTLAFTKGFGPKKINGKIVDITGTAKRLRQQILASSIPAKDKYMTWLQKMKTELVSGSLQEHPQAKKLLKSINHFLANGTLAAPGKSGKIIFPHTSRGGKLEWLIPGRDWEYTGVIVNNDETITAMDFTGRYAHYKGEWIPYKDLAARGNVVLSDRVFMSKRNITITKNGRTITIKAGKPFIVVSEDLSHNFTNMPEVALEALFNSDDIRTTFAYTEPPVSEISEWIQQVNTAEKEKGKVKTDIGNYATGYRILSTLLKTQEGREWIRTRLDSMYPEAKLKKARKLSTDEILNELDSILKRFDEIDKANKGVGDSNELVNALRTSLEEDGKTAVSQYPTIASLGHFATKKDVYGRIFNRVMRALALGTAPETTTGELHFMNPSESGAQENIATIKELIMKAPDTKYKDGKIHRHVEFCSDDNSVHVINGSTIIDVASKTDRSKYLDPTTTEVMLDAKLDTGILKTKGKAAKELEEAQDVLDSYVNGSTDPRAAIAEAHRRAYVYDDMGFLLQPPTPYSSNPTPQPGGTTARREEVAKVVKSFKQNPEEKSILHKDAETLVKNVLSSDSSIELNSEAVNTVIEDLIADGKLHRFKIDNATGKDFILVSDEALNKFFSSEDIDATQVSIDEKGFSLNTQSGKTTYNFVWQNNTAKLVKVSEQAVQQSSGSSGSEGSLTIKIGEKSVQVTPDQKLYTVFPEVESLNILEAKETSTSGASNLADVITGTLAIESGSRDVQAQAVQAVIDSVTGVGADTSVLPEELTMQHLVNILANFRDDISAESIDRSRMSEMFISGPQAVFDELIYSLAEQVKNPDSQVSQEESNQSCSISEIISF